MISSPELQDSIHNLTHTQEALVATSRRLASAFTHALESAGVDFHAVNEGLFALGNGYQPLQMCLIWNVTGKLNCLIREGLSYIDGSGQLLMPSITTLTDSELAEIARLWAHKVAGISKQIAFMNLYLPKSAEACAGYNDLRIAFRIIRAWDVSLSGYVMRIDAALKDLSR
jgi:sugar (pentulose or hexulose) kinase